MGGVSDQSDYLAPTDRSRCYGKIDAALGIWLAWAICAGLHVHVNPAIVTGPVIVAAWQLRRLHKRSHTEDPRTV